MLKEATPATLLFRDDPDAETVLSYVGVDSVVDKIRLADIDWNESANNCARLGDAIIPEKVAEYESSMRHGDVFPRIVAEVGKRGHVILGGNQRCSAAKRIDSDAEVEAYIVDPLTSGERELIIRSLNNTHGLGTTKEDRLEHALYLVREHGHSVKCVAYLMKVSETSINRRLRAERTRAELAKNGVDSNRFHVSHLDYIAGLQDVETQSQVGRLVEKYNPTSEQVRNVVASVANAGSRAKASRELKSWAKQMEDAKEVKKKSGGIKLPRREKFYKHLQGFSEFLERGKEGSPFLSLDELSCSEEVDGDRVRMYAKKIITRLNEITGDKE